METLKLDRDVPFVLGPTQVGNCQPQPGMNWRVRNLRARIGELCFLSRALSAEEIKRLYEGGVAAASERRPGS